MVLYLKYECYIKEVILLISEVEDYLIENIDGNINIIAWNGKDRLPLFLSELYDFYELNILEKHCIMMKFINDIPKIDDMKKHMKIIKTVSDDNLVFIFNAISSFKRKSLIDNRIPFVVKNGQMYLPFLGLDLKNTTDKSIKYIEKFSTSAQILFLWFLYNKELILNATELAEMLNVTVMTASRALNDLYSLGVLRYEVGGKTGRSKKYKRIEDSEYYEIGSKYLKNPINKVVYLDRAAYNMVTDLPVAGLEALSMLSMLNPPTRQVRAISKQKIHNIQGYIVTDRDKICDLNLMELQIWDYDPILLAKNNMVDLASLAMSLNSASDERVQQAIEESMIGETWYKD